LPHAEMEKKKRRREDETTRRESVPPLDLPVFPS
jgi:hypothetical protein